MDLKMLRLLKYVSSFVDGRVRIRHPALRREETLDLALREMRALPGVNSVDGNSTSGSVLILYDSAALPRDRVIAIGAAWAQYLDAVLAGQTPDPPRL